MGLLSRVAFMQGKSSVPDPLDTASSSSTASCDLDFAGAPTTPVTADAVANDCGDGPATAAAQPKYWPSQEEVAAVLAALGEEDRGFCDAAMANRWVRRRPRLACPPSESTMQPLVILLLTSHNAPLAATRPQLSAGDGR